MKNLLRVVKLSLVIASSLSVVSSAVIAQNLPAKGPIPFVSYDKNKDGSVSESEFYDARTARMSEKVSQGVPLRNAANAPDFSLFDTDNDGKLTKVELLEGQNKQMQKNRANRGQGQKGQMRNKEGNNMQGKGRNIPTFESYDLNADGHLTQNEMNEARAKRMKEKASQGKLLRNSANQTKFSDIDIDGNSKVSKQEFISNQMRKR